MVDIVGGSPSLVLKGVVESCDFFCSHLPKVRVISRSRNIHDFLHGRVLGVGSILPFKSTGPGVVPAD